MSIQSYLDGSCLVAMITIAIDSYAEGLNGARLRNIDAMGYLMI